MGNIEKEEFKDKEINRQLDEEAKSIAEWRYVLKSLLCGNNNDYSLSIWKYDTCVAFLQSITNATICVNLYFRQDEQV